MNCPKCNEILILTRVVITPNQLVVPQKTRNYIIHEEMFCRKCNGKIMFDTFIETLRRDTVSNFCDEMARIVNNAEQGSNTEQINMHDIILIPVPKKDDGSPSEID